MNKKGEKLLESIISALYFKGIDINEIENIENNCGGLWFTYNGKQHYIIIDECE